MPLGALSPLPLRLGGTATNGLTAAQHARIAADYVALKRSAPLAVWTYTLAAGVVTLHGYLGQNGAGDDHAWTSEVLGTGDVLWTFEDRNFIDPIENVAPIAIRHARAGVHGATPGIATVVITASSVRVCAFDASGSALDGKVTVKVY